MSEQIATSESPLLRLFQRKDTKGQTYVDARQFAAGENCAVTMSAPTFQVASSAPMRNQQAPAAGIGK